MPENWRWDDDWNVDVHRTVDQQGWEYCVEPSMGGWTNSERIYQLNRRRRWFRNRSVLKKSMQLVESGEVKSSIELAREGWEYAKLFSTKFHSKEQSSDGVRRRRWRRAMQPNEHLSADCVIENKEVIYLAFCSIITILYPTIFFIFFFFLFKE